MSECVTRSAHPHHPTDSVRRCLVIALAIVTPLAAIAAALGILAASSSVTDDVHPPRIGLLTECADFPGSRASNPTITLDEMTHGQPDSGLPDDGTFTAGRRDEALTFYQVTPGVFVPGNAMPSDTLIIETHHGALTVGVQRVTDGTLLVGGRSVVASTDRSAAALPACHAAAAAFYQVPDAAHIRPEQITAWC